MNPKTEHKSARANVVSLEVKTKDKKVTKSIGRTVEVASQSQQIRRVSGKNRIFPKKNEKNNVENFALIVLKKCDRKQMIEWEKDYSIFFVRATLVIEIDSGMLVIIV